MTPEELKIIAEGMGYEVPKDYDTYGGSNCIGIKVKNTHNYINPYYPSLMILSV